jgi:RNA polymerase sigma-70 factor (ECF subfamily)
VPPVTRTQDFVLLWTQHAQRVYAYLLTLVPNRADADELLQETSLTLWEKFDQFQPGSEFGAWARSVAFNKVRNFRQRSGNSVVHLDDELLELINAQATTDSETLDAQYRALADCYGKLRPTDQELITLRYRAGSTVLSVAQEAGRSVAAIYKALNRIHSNLFDCVHRVLSEEAPK